MSKSPSDFVVVWEGPGTAAAEVRASELRRHGIQAIAHDGELSGLPGMPWGPAQVLVPGHDAARARLLLGNDANP